MKAGDRAATFTAASRPLAVDLFAGAGGLSLGLEQAGFDIAAAVEYDPTHAAVHEFNFPHSTMFCRDVATMTPPTESRRNLTKSFSWGIRVGCLSTPPKRRSISGSDTESFHNLTERLRDTWATAPTDTRR